MLARPLCSREQEDCHSEVSRRLELRLESVLLLFGKEMKAVMMMVLVQRVEMVG